MLVSVIKHRTHANVNELGTCLSCCLLVRYSVVTRLAYHSLSLSLTHTHTHTYVSPSLDRYFLYTVSKPNKKGSPTAVLDSDASTSNNRYDVVLMKAISKYSHLQVVMNERLH